MRGHPMAKFTIELEDSENGVVQFRFRCEPALDPGAEPTDAQGEGIRSVVHLLASLKNRKKLCREAVDLAVALRKTLEKESPL